MARFTGSEKTIERQRKIVEKLIEKEGLRIVTDKFSYWDSGYYVVDDVGELVYCLSGSDVNSFHSLFKYEIWELVPSQFLEAIDDLKQAIEKYKKQKNETLEKIEEIEKELSLE